MRKAKATNSLSAGARRREPSVGRSAGNADVSVSYARGALRARLWVDVLCEPTWPGRSLLSCSDEAAFSHEELSFYSPCDRASEAQLRPSARRVRHRPPRRGQETLGPGRERLILEGTWPDRAGYWQGHAEKPGCFRLPPWCSPRARAWGSS